MKEKPKYKQGQFYPKNPSKYQGDINKIFYRSGLELKYFRYLDLNRTVLEWMSEEFFIPYTSVDGKTHRYFVDFWAKVKTNDGKVKEFIVEIKPHSQTIKPKDQKRITKQYKEKLKTYLINKMKWDAAEKFAVNNGMKFIILTEKDI